MTLADSGAVLTNLQAIGASGNRDAAMIETRLRQALKPADRTRNNLRGQSTRSLDSGASRRTSPLII